MKEFKKILFPVDLSEASPEIVPWVIMTATKFEAEIHLLFVARSLQYFSSVYVPVVSIETFEQEIIRGAESGIEEFANKYFEGFLTPRTRVVLGDAAEEIVRYVESQDVDLVIIGTHGRKGLERILFGSVAERVIKMSPVPVMSINPFRVQA